MKYKNLTHVWAHGYRFTDIFYVSNNEICYSSGNFLKIIDTDGTENIISAGPFGISCISASLSLGVIAICDAHPTPSILLAKYPNFNVLPMKLSSELERECLSMVFAGSEHLLSLHGKPDYLIIIWEWTSGRKLYTLKDSMNVEVPLNLRFSSMEGKASRVCLQLSKGLVFVDIEDFELQFSVERRAWYPPIVGDSESLSSLTDDKLFDLTVFDKMNNSSFGLHSDAMMDVPIACVTTLPSFQLLELYDYICGQKRQVPTSHCWLPSGDLVVSLSGGNLLKIKHNTLEARAFFEVPDSENPMSYVTGIAINTEAMYVGTCSGLLLKLNVAKETATLVHIIHLNVLCVSFVFSPTYDTLTIMSVDGAVYLYDTKQKDKYCTQCLVEGSDCSNVIGICTLFAAHFLVGRRDGALEFWSVDYGVMESRLKLGFPLTCLGGSPLCSIAFVGSETGYVHMIDATDVAELRVIRIFKVFDTSVSSIKYENFGRYVAFHSIEEGIMIMNGVPSAGMPLIGCWRIKNVDSICLFTKDTAKDTYLLALLKSTSCENEGNVLRRMVLPEGFYKNYKHYWKDGVPVLNETTRIDSTNLPHPGTSLLMHCVYGIIIFATQRHTIQVMLFSNDFPEALKIQAEIPTPHECDRCQLILDVSHNWLASLGEDGKVIVYNLRNPLLRYISPYAHFYKHQGATCGCFSEVKPLLITGGGDGSLVCEGWHPNIYQDPPASVPWVAHCWSLKEQQNTFVCYMVDKPQEYQESFVTLIAKAENKQRTLELQAWKRSLNERKQDIYNSITDLVKKNNSLPPDSRLPATDLVLDDGFIETLYKKRSSILLWMRYQFRKKLENIKKEAVKLKSEHIDTIAVGQKSLTSLRGNKVVSNYTIHKKHLDALPEMDYVLRKKYVQAGRHHHHQAGVHENNTETSGVLLYDPFDLKINEQKVDQIAAIRYVIHSKKMQFNQKFDELVKYKEEQKKEILSHLARLKFVLATLRLSDEVEIPNWERERDLSLVQLQLPEDDRTRQFSREERHRSAFFENARSDSATSNEDLISILNNMVGPRDEMEEDVLRELAKPDFMEEVPAEHWTKSETDIAKKFAAKLEAQSRRKLKYLAKLHDEMEELKSVLENLMTDFDNAHRQLLAEKLATDFYIDVKELNIAVIMLTMTVNMSYRSWLKHVQEVMLNKRERISDMDRIVSYVEKIAEKQAWKLAELQVKLRMVLKSIHEIKLEKRNYQLLIAAVERHHGFMMTECNPLDPYPKTSSVRNKEELLRILKTLYLEDTRPIRVSAEEWKQICAFRLEKLCLEERIEQQEITLNSCKLILELNHIKRKMCAEEEGIITEKCQDLRERHRLCLNDVPQVMEVPYKNLEMGINDDLNSCCMVLKRDVIDKCSNKINEARNMVLNTVKDGAYVRTQLKRSFLEYKRLNIKVQECQRKQQILVSIPLSKDLKAILATGVIDPKAKAEIIQQSAELKKRELERQIASSQAEEMRNERAIFNEILQYRTLEKRINKLEDDLEHLKKLCDDEKKNSRRNSKVAF